MSSPLASLDCSADARNSEVLGGSGNNGVSFFFLFGSRKKVVVVVVCVVVVVEYAIGCSPELVVDLEDSDNLGCGIGSVDPESSYGGGSGFEAVSVCGLSGASNVTLLCLKDELALLLFALNRRVDMELR